MYARHDQVCDGFVKFKLSSTYFDYGNVKCQCGNIYVYLHLIIIIT